MYGSEGNRISNIERPTWNVEVTRLSAEDRIITDQQDHKTTGLRTTFNRQAGGGRRHGPETKGVRKYESTNVRRKCGTPRG
jgi:hypothetical protein